MPFQHVNKSENDGREYRVITLQNGLRALLVADQMDYAPGANPSSHSESSDKESLPNQSRHSIRSKKKGKSQENDEEEEEECFSAAALCIGCGSFCDPPEVPGLAHFLEHMVFMGSEKYPDENEFDKFVNKNGGTTNATTDIEKTCFHFDVQQKAFEETLDRFAQFFVAPLLHADSVERELNAVDNEWNLLFTNDNARVEQLIASLSKPGHPISSLLYGNKETLLTSPNLGNKTAYDRLPKFYKTMYSAHYMTLAVISRDTLDNLEKLINRIFKEIPNNGIPKRDFSQMTDPFDTLEFTRLYKVVPVKNTHQLMITWALPSLYQFYRVKPLHYLSYLVGHQGQGSILFYLRKKYWALGLTTDEGFDNNATCSFFHISVKLSDEGMDHVYEVLCAVFEYICMLQHVGPQERIYNEIATIEHNGFRFLEQTDAVEYVEVLCKNMQLFEPVDYISGDLLLMEYNPKIIEQCTQFLMPRKANILLMSKDFEAKGICDQAEHWFGTKYRSEEIPQEWLNTWETTSPHAYFHLPAPNPYIPTDFTIKRVVHKSDYPVRINQSDLSTLWYKQDLKFNTPKAFVKFEMVSPVLSESPQAACMFDIYRRMVDFSLAETAYAAKSAQFCYDIEGYDSALAIQVHGFNDTLPQLFEHIIEFISNLHICQELLDSTIEELSKTYHNDSMKPFVLNREVRQHILHERHYSAMDCMAFLSNVTVSDMHAFVDAFKKRLSIQGLVQGNIEPSTALWMESILIEQLQSRALPPGVLKSMRLVRLPIGESYCRVRNMNSADSNSVITNYYQHGPSTLKEAVTNELMMSAMEEPLFDTLRTREQLGYTVYCSHRVDLGILAFSLTVCSHAEKFSMEVLDKHMEDFLLEFEELLRSMSNSAFKSRKNALMTQKQCDDTSLDMECHNNWGEIKQKTYMFDRMYRELHALEGVQKKDLINWFRKHTGSVGTRKLSIQVVGNVQPTMDRPARASPPPLSANGCAFGEGAKGMGPKRNSKDKLHLMTLNRMQILPVAVEKGTDFRAITDLGRFRDSCYLYPVSRIME